MVINHGYNINSRYSIYKLVAPEKLTGTTLEELDLTNTYCVNVLAIKRGNSVIVNPRAGEEIRRGYVPIVLGNEEKIQRIAG